MLTIATKLRMVFYLFMNINIPKFDFSFMIELSVKSVLLINIEMPQIVVILIFIKKIILTLIRAELKNF